MKKRGSQTASLRKGMPRAPTRDEIIRGMETEMPAHLAKK